MKFFRVNLFWGKTRANFVALFFFNFIAAFSFARAQENGDWKIVEPGWRYEFPRDHSPHADFKTEWWYFTGNLRDEKSGREFGYQLTWFREGILPLGERDSALSRFVVRDLKFAHFTISDLRADEFFFSQRISRGAFGEAGFGAAPGKIAWIENWQLFFSENGTDGAKNGVSKINASDENRALDLQLVPEKPPVIHGENGVSQKAEGAGHASCYYSFTRLRTSGTLSLRGANFAVRGESWFDHEWATNQLAPDQAGWNWFSIQLSDQSELMLYQMRKRDGSSDPNSSGTFIFPNGESAHLTREDFELTPLAWWKSAATGGRYPLRWRLRIARLALDLEIATPLEKQELALESLAYWEGAIRVSGTRENRAVSGHGYMELTGYTAALPGLRAPEKR